MRLNADFSKRIVVRPEDYQWVTSPMPGVERMMLDRIGDEVARATSLVRYAPNSTFSSHVHGGGEEFFVLEGVFADEHRSYPVGSYVRNPIGTEHAPKVGSDGCVIFVKLHQFDERDQDPVVIDTRNGQWTDEPEMGLETMQLHDFEGEQVSLARFASHSDFEPREYPGGVEIFVLEGVIGDEYGTYAAGTWIRSPRGSTQTPRTGDAGALCYVKVGHLT